MDRSVESRGHTIGYRVAGDGTPLVLLCGWSQWADQWWDYGYVDQLRDRYRIIAVDRLGHGRSDKPHDSGEYLEPLVVADIVAVLDAEDVDIALVWGFSMGSLNAASLAELHPHRVAALVCGGSPPVPRSPDQRAQFAALSESVRSDDGMTAFLQTLGTPPEAIADSLERNDSKALAAALAGLAEGSPSPERITAPSLWYIGADDRGGLSAEAADAAARVGAETHVIAGADHADTFLRADDVLDFVRPFLDRNATRS